MLDEQRIYDALTEHAQRTTSRENVRDVVAAIRRVQGAAQDITPEQAIAELLEAGADDTVYTTRMDRSSWQKRQIETIHTVNFWREGAYRTYEGATLREATDKALGAMK